MSEFFKKVEIIAIVLIILLTAIGSSNSILRYLGNFFQVNLSSNLFLELQWYIFSIIFLLGFSITHISDKNIRVDVFYEKLSASKKKRINKMGAILLFFPFIIVLVVFSVTYFWESIFILEQSSDTQGIPRFIIKAFMPLGFILLLVAFILKFRK